MKADSGSITVIDMSSSAETACNPLTWVLLGHGLPSLVSTGRSIFPKRVMAMVMAMMLMRRRQSRECLLLLERVSTFVWFRLRCVQAMTTYLGFSVDLTTAMQESGAHRFFFEKIVLPQDEKSGSSVQRLTTARLTLKLLPWTWFFAGDGAGGDIIATQ
jgi:hypothetical protein